jgi:hypothetical protein
MWRLGKVEIVGPETLTAVVMTGSIFWNAYFMLVS